MALETARNGAQRGGSGHRPSASPFGAEPFVVELDRFQGPLDLLLHLIRSQDIDIFDIPIARITHQFQQAIEANLDAMSLDRAGEFLELAATLVRIKVQLLLPRPGDLQWDEDPRADLVRRLLEYEYFQEVARVLASAEADRSRHLAKGYLQRRPRQELVRRKLRLTLEEFLEAAGRVPEQAPEPRAQAPSLVVTVEEKIALVRGRLRRAKRFAFRKLFSSWSSRSHVVAALLACLELAKQQLLRIEQTERFGSIWLFRGSRSIDEPAETLEAPAQAGDGPEAPAQAGPAQAGGGVEAPAQAGDGLEEETDDSGSGRVTSNEEAGVP